MIKDWFLVTFWKIKKISGKMKIVLAYILQTLLALLILAVNKPPLLKDKSIIEVFLTISLISIIGFAFSFIPIMLFLVILRNQINVPGTYEDIIKLIIVVSLIGLYYMALPVIIFKTL